MQNNEELFLGDTFTTIIEEATRQLPAVSEYRFEREVLNLLVNPFNKEALRQYLPYVQGNLAYPLRVVDNQDMTKVLFTVPALLQTPITTIPVAGGMSAENFFNSLKREMELGNPRVNDKICAFMNRITKVPDYQKVVLEPLQAILKRYNRTFEVPTSPTSPSQEPVPPGETLKTTSSFGDDYED